jgi:hypothetical protein
MIHAAEAAFADGLQVNPGLAILLNGLGEVRQRRMLEAYGTSCQIFPRPFLTVSWSASPVATTSPESPRAVQPTISHHAITPSPDPSPCAPSGADSSDESDAAVNESCDKADLSSTCKVLEGNDLSMLERHTARACTSAAEVVTDIEIPTHPPTHARARKHTHMQNRIAT